MKKGYFNIMITIGLLVVGLLYLPAVNISSLEGVFSILWFAMGAVVVIANYIHILNAEKRKKMIPRMRKSR